MGRRERPSCSVSVGTLTNSSTTEPGTSPPSRDVWQETLLQHLAWGLSAVVAVVVLGSVLLISDAAASELLLVLLSGTLFSSLASFARVGYRLRAVALCFAATASAVGFSLVRGPLDASAYLLALVACALSRLLLGRGGGVVSALTFLAIEMLTCWAMTEVGDAAGTYRALSYWLTFACVTGACLWWADLSVATIREAFIERDELIDLVREETEERIEQLEKQQSLERQLRQSQKMEALGTLAGGIAHDFNNLLLVIASGAESARDADEGERAVILQELKDAAARGGALTNQLLAFGRRKINERGAISLNREIEKSLQMIRRLIPANVQLIFQPGQDVCAIEATAVDIDQVMMNLCINARDAMPGGGKLTIATSLHRPEGCSSDEVVIVVRDTGMGMSSEAKERAFEPFFTTKRTGAGTGLGLSVVHTIVKNHKGRMVIDSTEGLGSEFRVFFPHYEQGLFVSPKATETRPQPTGERILLVDDDQAVQKGIARVLRRAGYEVVTASDGEEALNLFQESERPVALVVTDAIMPNMGGRDLCEALGRLSPGQPCLVCSGYDAGTIEEGFFLEEGREFLAKPFDNDELLARVRALLDLRRISARPPRISEKRQWSRAQ